MPSRQPLTAIICYNMLMNRKAFTLVELLVVIAIIGLLSTVAVVSLSSSRTNARNMKRKADLVQISKALELYYSQNGTYPSTGGSAYPGNQWSLCSAWTVKGESGPDGWIPDLAPTYMATLPRDPRSNQGNTNPPVPACTNTPTWSCYVYMSDGIDYKVMAFCTPEGTISATDPFYDPGHPGFDYSIYTPGARLW
jgi:prepilin-type N-terminal cleavage/methylation domain-containing protein